MKKIPLVAFVLLSLACGFVWPLRPSSPPVTSPSPVAVIWPTVTMPLPEPMPWPTATFSPSPTPSYSLYQNRQYGFSISYPDFWPLYVQTDQYIKFGEKVVIIISDMDPLQPMGDRPVYETITDVQVGSQPGKLVMGYLGGVGGFVPQQLRMYIFERNGIYFMPTLYALGLKEANIYSTEIVPLQPEDQKVFDDMVAGFRFE